MSVQPDHLQRVVALLDRISPLLLGSGVRLSPNNIKSLVTSGDQE